MQYSDSRFPDTASIPLNRLRPPSSWMRPAGHLSELLQSPWYRHLHRTRVAVDRATRDFFDAEQADFLHVPVTTGSVSSPMGLGSDSLPVLARIGDNDIYLADSLQFLLELGVRISGRSVYYVSSSFRGEEVDSTHLAEFSHAEVEVPGDLDAIIGLGGRYISTLAQGLLDDGDSVIGDVAGGTGHIERVARMAGSFERVRLDEALRILSGEPGVVAEILPGVPVLTRVGERALMRHVGGPVWLTHLKAKACPFYQAPETGTDACLSADLLLGPGEILGSGQRCTDVEEVLTSLHAHAVSPSAYDWYLEMKRLQPLQTAGFGLGIERFLMWALDAEDIRDCTLWLRKYGEVTDP